MNIGNQKLQKKISRERIINYLRQNGNMSRSQIAEVTKLGWGSITRYTGELLKEKIVREVGTQKSKGRNSVILGLNQNYKYIIGLDIGASFIKGVVVNMCGVECAFLCEETLWNADRNTVLNQIYNHIDNLLEKAGILQDRVLAIGCGIAGGVDFEDGIVKRAGNFSDFDQVPLAELIHKRFNVPCYLANSIIVRLLGESKSRQVAERKNVAYISLGTGIGAGVILQSKILVPTEDEKIGDIAHYMVKKDGPQCYCGLHGCLETLVGARHLMNKIKSELEGSNSILKNEQDLSWKKIREAAENKDEFVCNILEESGHYIGMALCGVIQFHRPDLIVLGGGMTNLGNSLIQPIKDEVTSTLPEERFDVKNIVISNQANRSGAVGATSYAWDNIFHTQHEYVNLKLKGTI